MPTRRGEDPGEVVVATFTSAILDGQTMQAVRDELSHLAEQPGCRKLLLDFRNVEYLSSEAAGTLITLHKRLSTAGARLVLCDLAPDVYEMFHLTRLDRLFSIEDGPLTEQGGVEIHPEPRNPTKQRWDGGPIFLPFPPPEQE
jgi:anti-sigma B factor antagonist